MFSEFSRHFRQGSLWGLRRAPVDSASAQRTEQRWRWPTLLALACTIPAFYVELLRAALPVLASAAYLLAALTTALALLHTAWRSARLTKHLAANPLDLLLVLGLLLAAALPASSHSAVALAVRLVVAFMSLLRMMWSLRHLIARGGLAYLLMLATLVLGLCGVGFWWLEPKAATLGDGLWLAFTTAATVGYGDIVPSTPASKIFSVFVVMLGFGVLSLVTAAIATYWVETEERQIEREILHDMRRQIGSLHREIAQLRYELTQRGASPDTAVGPDPADPD